ncbi:MAG: DUF1684 domain-containing protein [Gemmatimonadetes bacterium]|nr:DUF1684 domain-containing protein [Gemmatimonadota bacterium]
MRSNLRRAAIVLALLLPLPAAAAPTRPRPTPPAQLSPAQADSLRAAYEKDRLETGENLKSGATSYLAAIGRTDFDGRTALVVGRAADADLRIDDTEIAAKHLRVTVAGDSFFVQAIDDTAHFRVRNGEPMREAMLGPGNVRVGRFNVRLSHQRYPALIVFDPKSPHFAAYHGLSWYAPDLAYRFVAPLTPNPAADTTIIMSTRGNARRAVLAGWFDLLVAGKPARLEAHRLLEPGVDEQSVSVFFRDATTGRETYSVGRYVDPEKLPDGRWLIDFNNAYNPACATSPYYNCPIPSKANTLKVAIKAGEKDSHYSH